MEDPNNPNPAAQTPPTNTPPKAQQATPGTTPPPAAQTDAQAAKAVVESAGLDYDAIVSEYRANNGSISEKTSGELKQAVKKLGLPETVVDRYFNGLAAEQTQFMSSVYQITGGEEGYEEMVAWAKESLSPKELQTINAMADSDDAEQALMAVRLLHGQYQQNAGVGGSRVKATSGAPSGSGTFKNMSEYAAALADPKYSTSPSYQEEVVAKLQRSIASGEFKPY